MTTFDVALEVRLNTSPEITAVNVTADDTLLIRNSADGVVMRIKVSTLITALAGSFAALVSGKVVNSQINFAAPDAIGSTTPAAVTATTLTSAGGATALSTTAALTDVSGVDEGTLTNAPTAGNPTKWIAINDGGTTRKIPTWT